MRALRLPLVVSLFTFLGLYTASPVRANGRFPKAQVVATVPGGDGSVVYLRATFGVLASRDGGKHFTWLCEQALGFSSTWDPPISVTRDGRLWIALTSGLRVTKDGCDVQGVPALDGELVADLTVDGRGEEVYAITSTPDKPAFVWRSHKKDDAFERLGAGIRNVRFDTIEVAPSKAARVYLTGVPEANGPRAHFFRSDDGGVTLRETKPVLPMDGRLFVSAVDPKDADRVLVRLLHEKGSDVLLSTDGGATFKPVLHLDGAMFGFARSDDGANVYAGSGDPREGIWRSRDRGEHWEAAAKASVFCLHASGDRLFACSNPYTPGGFALALSTDRGATLAPLATFDDVTGPVACDAGAGTKCAASWGETHAMIATSAQMPAIDAPRGDASSPPVASAAASSSAASSSSTPTSAKSSCGCRLAEERSTSRAFAIPLVMIVAGAFAMRRRSGSRSPH